jgi:hypothetical protein
MVTLCLSLGSTVNKRKLEGTGVSRAAQIAIVEGSENSIGERK